MPRKLKQSSKDKPIKGLKPLKPAAPAKASTPSSPPAPPTPPPAPPTPPTPPTSPTDTTTAPEGGDAGKKQRRCNHLVAADKGKASFAMMQNSTWFLENKPSRPDAAAKLMELTGIPITANNIDILCEMSGVHWEFGHSQAKATVPHTATRVLTRVLTELLMTGDFEVPADLIALNQELNTGVEFPPAEGTNA